MKIVFVVGELGLGGAERQLLVLARGLARIGHRVTVAVFRRGGAMETDAVATGVAIEPLGGGPLRIMVRLRRFLASEHADIVHGYLTAANIAVLSGFAVRPRPLIVWGFRASDMDMRRYGRKPRLASWTEWKLARLPNLLIANSVAGQDRLLRARIAPERVAMIPNGIDVARFNADPERRAAARRE